jgi:competence protein ComEA
MAASQTTGSNVSGSQQGMQMGMPLGSQPRGLVGAAKYGAVGVLGFLAGAGTLWSVSTREPAAIAAVQQPAPIQLPPIVVQPPQVVIQMPPQGAPSAPPIAPPVSEVVGDAGPMGPPAMGDSAPGDVPQADAPVVPVVAPVVVTPVPVATPVSPAPISPGATDPSRAAKLNLNTATTAQLELLPGIGPSLAARIVAYRAANGRFTSIADLDKVDGIGPKTLERLSPLVTVD